MSKTNPATLPRQQRCGRCRYVNHDSIGVWPTWVVCRKFGEAAHPEGGCIWGKRDSGADSLIRVRATER